MMRGANTAKLAALSVAIIAHGAFALALLARDEVQVEGADGGTEVRLGTGFADMAAGTLTAERPVETEKPAADVPDRIKAERAERTPPEKTVSAPEADPLSTPVERTSKVAETKPSLLTPIDRVSVLQAVKEKLTPLAPAVRQAVQAERPKAVESAAGPERIEGSAPDRSAVDRAPRPKRKPATKPARSAATQPGNAARNARAGEATGKREAVARKSGNGGRQQAAGNAAVSNYPGLVMRKLSRAGKPRITARGTAVVAFTITANGALATVSLARGSGSAALDQAAIRLVRGAAPFPKPPRGARRSFSIQIKGR